MKTIDAMFYWILLMNVLSFSISLTAGADSNLLLRSMPMNAG